MKRPTEDATHFQLTKWLPDKDFKLVTTSPDEGKIKWKPKDLGRDVKNRYSIWREKRGYVARTV